MTRDVKFRGGYDMGDSRSDFIREIVSGENKYIYYLLAATGACIGFAINKTDEAVLSWPQAVAILAIACWCRLLHYLAYTRDVSAGG